MRASSRWSDPFFSTSVSSFRMTTKNLSLKISSCIWWSHPLWQVMNFSCTSSPLWSISPRRRFGLFGCLAFSILKFLISFIQEFISSIASCRLQPTKKKRSPHCDCLNLLCLSSCGHWRSRWASRKRRSCCRSRPTTTCRRRRGCSTGAAAPAAMPRRRPGSAAPPSPGCGCCRRRPNRCRRSSSTRCRSSSAASPPGAASPAAERGESSAPPPRPPGTRRRWRCARAACRGPSPARRRGCPGTTRRSPCRRRWARWRSGRGRRRRRPSPAPPAAAPRRRRCAIAAPPARCPCCKSPLEQMHTESGQVTTIRQQHKTNPFLGFRWNLYTICFVWFAADLALPSIPRFLCPPKKFTTCINHIEKEKKKKH